MADEPRNLNVTALRGPAAGVNPFKGWRVEPDEDQATAMLAVVRMAEMFCEMLFKQVPPGPDRTLVIRSLEECVMRANYAITHPPTNGA